jgi:hypothetical protein
MVRLEPGVGRMARRALEGPRRSGRQTETLAVPPSSGKEGGQSALAQSSDGRVDHGLQPWRRPCRGSGIRRRRWRRGRLCRGSSTAARSAAAILSSAMRVDARPRRRRRPRPGGRYPRLPPWPDQDSRRFGVGMGGLGRYSAFSASASALANLGGFGELLANAGDLPVERRRSRRDLFQISRPSTTRSPARQAGGRGRRGPSRMFRRGGAWVVAVVGMLSHGSCRRHGLAASLC